MAGLQEPALPNKIRAGDCPVFLVICVPVTMSRRRQPVVVCSCFLLKPRGTISSFGKTSQQMVRKQFRWVVAALLSEIAVLGVCRPLGAHAEDAYYKLRQKMVD